MAPCERTFRPLRSMKRVLILCSLLFASADAFESSPFRITGAVRVLETQHLFASASPSASSSSSSDSTTATAALPSGSMQGAKEYRWSQRWRRSDTESFTAPVEELTRKLLTVVSEAAKGSYQSAGQWRAALARAAASRNTADNQVIKAVVENLHRSARYVRTWSSASVQATKSALRSSWWSLPMLICLWPLYHAVVLQQDASMPSWWQVFRMDHIVASPDAVGVVGFFLLSNIAYFLAAAHLLARFPPVQAAATAATATASSSRLWTRLKQVIPRPTRHTGLGLWVAAAGAMSTIFHSVQALGDYGVAEGLCYLDHGIAATAILYFWNVLGKPDRSTQILSAAGLVTLVITDPGYAWLHSTWHFLSAAAAVSWATQGSRRTTAEGPLKPADPTDV